jgi:type I restriction enzyme, S subunit
MSEWIKYKFLDFAELRKEQVAPNGVEQPYIGLDHIEQQSLRLNGIGSSNEVISNKFKFYSGDVLYGKLRPYFRKVYNPKFEGVCSTDIFVIKNKELVDKIFLFYLVATEDFTSIANSGSSGTRMPRAEWNQLAKSEWQLPHSIEEQKQIASILSSLDDKIELNLQMNHTLEAMAQALFKEWFVNFNFPGFNGELVDGLPKGWRMGKVKEMYKTTSGGTPSRAKEEYYDNGTINWVKSKELNGSFIFDTEEKITVDAVKNSEMQN